MHIIGVSTIIIVWLSCLSKCKEIIPLNHYCCIVVNVRWILLDEWNNLLVITLPTICCTWLRPAIQIKDWNKVKWVFWVGCWSQRKWWNPNQLRMVRKYLPVSADGQAATPGQESLGSCDILAGFTSNWSWIRACSLKIRCNFLTVSVISCCYLVFVHWVSRIPVTYNIKLK